MSDEVRSLVAARFARSIAEPEAFFEAEADRIAHACWQMARRFHQGGRLIAFGNGAFASDAQHVAVEFVHPVIVGKRALPALALTNDGTLLPHGGDGVDFSRQLTLLGRPQDIALAFSLDGADANVVEALTTAQQMGMLTLALTGAERADLASARPDFCFAVASGDALVVQEVHETLYHILWELVHVFFEHEGLLKE